jgi:hypothetical protein
MLNVGKVAIQYGSSVWGFVASVLRVSDRSVMIICNDS